MTDGPHIARVAGLIGEPARAEMLGALMGGQALTATELAAAAGISKQTASVHLARLVDARLVEVQPQGRHRYFRLAGGDVAELLETLSGVAQRAGVWKLRPGPREPALRAARVCYDHLAGEAGVQLLEALLRRRHLRVRDDAIAPTRDGIGFFGSFGIDVPALAAQRRPLCRACLDWSERRNHLAGALGAALLERLFALGWAKRAARSRVVTFTPAGVKGLHDTFGAGPR